MMVTLRVRWSVALIVYGAPLSSTSIVVIAALASATVNTQCIPHNASQGQCNCNPQLAGGCNVCARCCESYIVQDQCGFCFERECTATPAPTPELEPRNMKYYVQYVSGALLPFVLRTLQSVLERKTKACVQQACCGCSSSFGPSLGLGTSDSSLVGSNLVGLWEIERSRYNRAVGWSRARRELKWSCCGALFMGFLRLTCWHLMQPAVYSLVLFHYAPQIDQKQYKLGLVVFFREMSYALLVLVGLFWRPAYLLVNLDADLGSRYLAP